MKTNRTPERKRINYAEYDALIALEAVHAALMSPKTFPALQDRLRGFKYGARDAGAIKSALRRLLNGLYAGVPYEQLSTLSHNIKMSAMHIGVQIKGRRDTDQNNYGMILSWEQLDELGRAAMEKCITCSLDTQQQRQCPLAKVLDQLPAHKDDSAKGCGYFGF